ncbi:MAG: SDR family NAD(P)-dependent oxidoreductase, partial [Pseudomonadales bacterium]
MDLNDKVAFITGGASGLGRATAENFIAAGARVMLFDLNEENVQKTAEELGGNAAFAAGDVADEQAVSAAIQKALDTFGSIHINVNSAGIGAAGRTVGRDGPMPLKNFEFVVRVNLVGTFNVLRLCAAAMQNNEPVTQDGERGV